MSGSRSSSSTSSQAPSPSASSGSKAGFLAWSSPEALLFSLRDFSRASCSFVRGRDLAASVFAAAAVLDLTSRPNETRFRREVPVPGVRRMPCGLVGDSYPLWSSAVVALAFSDLAAAALVSFLDWTSLWGAGVPKRARLNALAANTGAGVSGCSANVSSAGEARKSWVLGAVQMASSSTWTWGGRVLGRAARRLVQGPAEHCVPRWRAVF